MKKYYILILSLLSLLANAQPGLAAGSGACSYHSGVDCEAGADWDGSAVCRDGWRNSSVLYKDVCSSSDKKVYLTDRKEYDQAILEIEKAKKSFLSSFDLRNYHEDCSSKETETYNICIATYSSGNLQMIHIGAGSSQMQNAASQQESKCKLEASTAQSLCEYRNSSRSVKRDEYERVFEDQKLQYVFVEVKETPPKQPDCSVYGSNSTLSSANTCVCKTGYTWNDAKSSCVASVGSCQNDTIFNRAINACISLDQMCASYFGKNSFSTGVKDSAGNPTCKCKEGFIWDTSGKNECTEKTTDSVESEKVDMQAFCTSSLGQDSTFNSVTGNCQCRSGFEKRDDICKPSIPAFSGAPKTKSDLLRCLFVGNKTNKLYYAKGHKTVAKMTLTGKTCFAKEADAKKAGYRKTK